MNATIAWKDQVSLEWCVGFIWKGLGPCPQVFLMCYIEEIFVGKKGSDVYLYVEYLFLNLSE